MRLRYAVAAGAGLIALALGLFALGSDHRSLGTNGVTDLTPVRFPNPGNRACQELDRLPGGAGIARIRAESESGRIESLEVVVAGPSGPISKGELAASSDGVVDVPLAPLTRSSGEATICVANEGDEKLTLWGEQKRPYRKAPIRIWDEVYTVNFLDDGESSWLGRADVIADRYRLGHVGYVGGWGLWVAVLLGVGAVVLSLWLTARAAREAEPGDANAGRKGAG